MSLAHLTGDADDNGRMIDLSGIGDYPAHGDLHTPNDCVDQTVDLDPRHTLLALVLRQSLTQIGRSKSTTVHVQLNVVLVRNLELEQVFGGQLDSGGLTGEALLRPGISAIPSPRQHFSTGTAAILERPRSGAQEEHHGAQPG